MGIPDSGYQVLRKWLDDRKGRQVSIDEIKTYAKIVIAIKETIAIQTKIDKLYVDVEKSLISFNKNSEKIKLDKFDSSQVLNQETPK